MLPLFCSDISSTKPVLLGPFVPSEVEGRSLTQACLDFGHRPKFIPSACLAGSRGARHERVNIKGLWCEACRPVFT